MLICTIQLLGPIAYCWADRESMVIFLHLSPGLYVLHCSYLNFQKIAQFQEYDAIIVLLATDSQYMSFCDGIEHFFLKCDTFHRFCCLASV